MNQHPAPFLPGQPSRPSGSRGPKILTLVGVLALVLATALVLAGVGRFTGLVPDGFRDADATTDEYLRGTTAVPGNMEIQAEAGRRFVIEQQGGGSQVVPVGAVSVEGPDGRDVVVSAAGHTPSTATPQPSTSSPSDRGEPTVRVGSFTALDAGTYTISVTQPDGVDTTGAELRVLDDQFLSDIASEAGTGVLFLVVGGLIGALGLGLSIGGVTWWIVRADGRRRLAPPGRGYPQAR